MIHKLTKKILPLKVNAFITTQLIENRADPIFFYYHRQVTHMMVPQKFRDLSQKLHITFILFVSMCTHMFLLFSAL